MRRACASTGRRCSTGITFNLVLQGHDHAYQRTYPLRQHHRVNDPGRGTIYVIAVSGDKFVERAPRPYVAVGLAGVATYQTIETDPRAGKLTYRAWTEDGRAIDELTLEKLARPFLVRGVNGPPESTTR